MIKLNTPLYSKGGFIEAETLGQVLGWQIGYHGGYVEIISDPLDVNQNFAMFPEHDMKVISAWFLNNDYTLYGWDDYTPKYE